MHDNIVRTTKATKFPGRTWEKTITKWLITETLEAITILSRLDRLDMWTMQLQIAFAKNFPIFERKRSSPLSYEEARSLVLCVLAGLCLELLRLGNSYIVTIIISMSYIFQKYLHAIRTVNASRQTQICRIVVEEYLCLRHLCLCCLLKTRTIV